VKQILAFSRQTEQELRPMQLGPIVKEALKLLRASLPATVEIQRNIAGDLNTVLADPTQIHQVLMNLCTNAAHAMRERGGVLELAISNVELGDAVSVLGPQTPPGPYIRLSVCDTGHGMRQDIMEKIFDPYFTT
jgi:two-component system, cell cycle sensor histidine kinase and response regulator CckA